MKTRHDTKAARTARFYESMSKLGFTYEETEILRRAEMTLHRWAERECNGEVGRDEETGKTVRAYDFGKGRKTYPVPDRETGALRRIKAAVEARNSREAGEPVSFYHQTDPRGCALYILRPGDVPRGEDPGSYYSRGFAVCI